ncbi:MAG: hypothetical protein ACFCU3_10125 [Verrucomicrobiales bacterium]
MRPDWSDYPLSVFFDSIGHYVLRISALVAVLLLGTAVGIVLAWPKVLLYVFDRMLYLVPGLLAAFGQVFVVGLHQGWGLLAQLTLCLFACLFLLQDLSYKWLIFAFAVQGLETIRCALTFKP